MKPFVTLIVFGVLYSTGNLIAQPAHEYWFLVENRDHTVADFVDAKSISPEKQSLKRAWVVAYHSANAKDYPSVQMSLLTEFNCKTGQSRSLQVTLNDSSGQPVPSASEDAPADWAYVVPGSLGDTELRFVCTRSKKERTAMGVKIPARYTLVEAAQLLFRDDTAAPSVAASQR
jgi:hypothetical protein